MHLSSHTLSHAPYVAPASAVCHGSSASCTRASGVPLGVGVEEIIECLQVGGGWHNPGAQLVEWAHASRVVHQVTGGAHKYFVCFPCIVIISGKDHVPDEFSPHIHGLMVLGWWAHVDVPCRVFTSLASSYVFLPFEVHLLDCNRLLEIS